MDQVDLKEKFPQMKPMSGAPILFRVNGCGLSVFGHRDDDPETRTYVKTYCLSFLLIPIIPICAYRVADAANGGWYFLGKEPLSGFARIYNYFLLSAILVLCGMSAWTAHIHSPEYKFGKSMAEAAELEASGQIIPAAQKYSGAFSLRTSQAPTAAEKFFALAKNNFQKLSPQEDIVLLNSLPLFAPPADVKKALNDMALARVGELKENDPRTALMLLDATRSVASDSAEKKKLREEILEKIVAKNPEDLEVVSELASLYEARKQFDKCEAVLAPVAKKLGSTDGARILGGIYAAAGKIEEAFALLAPYCEARLQKLHAAETAYNKSMENAWNQHLNQLKNGHGPRTFYNEIENMSQDRRDVRIQEYLNDQLQRDGNVKAAQDALAKQAVVVPVALDLGIVRLRRAQGMTDPAERKKELEAAEKLFLAIRGIAGQTDDYKLFFGQICYWLGKHEEGKKTFDDLLASKNRSNDMLMAVANVYKEVGAGVDGRALMEEAYNKETDRQKKFLIASARAAILIDLDDMIKWLKLCDPASAEDIASLNEALGRKDVREGNLVAAEKHLREALAGYQKMQKSGASLNNGALAAFALYSVTRNRKDFQQGLEMMEEAATLAPSNAILLINLSEHLLDEAAYNAIGSALDYNALNINPGMDKFAIVYNDVASREQLVKNFIAQPSYQRAMANFDRLLVIAPRNATVYQTLVGVLSFTRDAKKMAEVLERARHADIDPEHNIQTLEAYSGKKDDASRAEIDVVVKKFEKQVAANPAGKRAESICCAYLSTWLMAGRTVGAPYDTDRVVKLAERAYAAEISQQSRSCLLNALMTRALLAVEKQDAQFEALCKKFERMIATNRILAYALAQGGKTRDTILQNADIKRALELMKEDGKAQPDSREGWEWPFFSTTDPAEAQAIATALKAERVRLLTALSLLINNVDTGEALDAYFENLAAGDEAAGRKILQEFSARGAPVPQK
jgi:hypothetical protein